MVWTDTKDIFIKKNNNKKYIASRIKTEPDHKNTLFALTFISSNEKKDVLKMRKKSPSSSSSCVYEAGKQAVSQLSKESESIFMVFIIVRFHINNTKLFNGNYRHV